jgi:hypothetical protein
MKGNTVMNKKASRLVRACGTLTSAVLLLLAGRDAMAVEYWLQTGTTTISGVPMWGYALCGTGSTAPAACTGLVTVPGPALVVPPGEGLIVHLTNTLPEPTSLVIAGQSKQEAMLPVWFEPGVAATTYSGSRPSGNTTARVRSFDKEAAPGGGTATYTWATIKPGTYLYSSGTHPQVQVQMGLYGALTKDAGAGKVAYSQGATNIVYRDQITLLYSEIDPALHAAVAGGTYGGAPGPTSTLNYNPKFFLINGKPYPDGSLNPAVPSTLPAGQTAVPAGQNLLVRFLNAGLRTHVPTINGQYWQMIAEDGNPLPYLDSPRQQYTAFLPAGKTLDVLLKPTNASPTDTVRYAIYDSRHYDTTDGNPGGGLLVKLDVGPSAPSAPVFDSTPVTTAIAGTAYTYAAHATDPDGQTVTYTLRPTPPTGMTINSATGVISWLAGGAAGSPYPVTVRASDTTTPTPLFSDQTFNIVVTAGANRPPVAVNDAYTAVVHAANLGPQSVAARGVLTNDTDPDGDVLTAMCVSGACAGTAPRVVLNANGGFTLASSTLPGNIQFTYRARDAVASSADATVTITMIANRAPTAVADAATAPRCTFRPNPFSNTCRTGTGFYAPVAINLAGNDTDPDTVTMDAANQLPLAVARVRTQSSSGGGGTTANTTGGGTVTISGASVTYVPRYNYTGSDTFQYRVKDKLGKESGSTNTDTNNLGAGWATVTVTVQ